MPSGASSPPRRVTRAAIAKFAYSDGSPTKESSTKPAPPRRSAQPITDIEDVIGSPVSSRKRKRVGAAIKTEVEVTQTTSSTPRRVRKPARTVHDAATGESQVAAPSDWEEMYGLVKEMRLSGPAVNAAVDTMGCERLALRTASPRDQRFHTLVALMLSSQTKDTVNAVAMARLQKDLPPYKPGAEPGLNLENMLAVDPDLLNQMIWAVGFHNNKTKYLKQAAEILRDKYNGDIPDTIEGLTSLPGVGPKMAHLCLSTAWGRTEGIGVDVHVHRITNMWGWHSTKNPEGTRAALESWLPKDKWREINWLLVGFGQTVCLPVGRKCGDCELGLRGLCKAAERKKVIEGRKIRETKLEVGEDGEVVKVETEIKEEVLRDQVVELMLPAAVKSEDIDGSLEDVKTVSEVDAKEDLETMRRGKKSRER